MELPDARDPHRPGVLVTIGDLVEDVVVWSSGAVQYATDNPSVIHRARGGSAANVAAFACASVPARFIGCVGDDPVGFSIKSVQSSFYVRFGRKVLPPKSLVVGKTPPHPDNEPRVFGTIVSRWRM